MKRIIAVPQVVMMVTSSTFVEASSVIGPSKTALISDAGISSIYRQIPPLRFIKTALNGGSYIFNRFSRISENSSVLRMSLGNNLIALLHYCTADFWIIDDAHRALLEGCERELLVDRFENLIHRLLIFINEVTWDVVCLYRVRQTQSRQISIVLVPRRNTLIEEQATFILNPQSKRWGNFFKAPLEEINYIPFTSDSKCRLLISEVIH